MNKRLSVILSGMSLATLLLTACGGTGTAALPQGAASPGTEAPATPSAAVGTVLLSVNPEIEMDYDASGNVVALTGLNADGQTVLASYTGYEGKSCATVAGELVAAMNTGGYFDSTIDGREKNIVLKLEQGSA